MSELSELRLLSVWVSSSAETAIFLQADLFGVLKSAHFVFGLKPYILLLGFGTCPSLQASPFVSNCGLGTCLQTPDATPDEIKKAYYSCMKTCHPDLSGNTPAVNEFCMFVNEVYEVNASMALVGKVAHWKSDVQLKYSNCVFRFLYLKEVSTSE